MPLDVVDAIRPIGFTLHQQQIGVDHLLDVIERQALGFCAARGEIVVTDLYLGVRGRGLQRAGQAIKLRHIGVARVQKAGFHQPISGGVDEPRQLRFRVGGDIAFLCGQLIGQFELGLVLFERIEHVDDDALGRGFEIIARVYLL